MVAVAGSFEVSEPLLSDALLPLLRVVLSASDSHRVRGTGQLLAS